MTELEYRSNPAWSKSDLDLISKSPVLWQYQKDIGVEPTPAMEFGAALHCAILTPKTYEAEYAIAPHFDRRTKDGKAGYAEFCQKNEGKKIISQEDDLQIVAMAEQVFHHPVAKYLFTAGEAEKPFFWQDKKTGIQCKCRPDYLRVDGVAIDLKSAASCSPHEFARSVNKYRYHVQAAYYSDGVEAATGMKVTDFVFVAIEKDPPYGLRIYRLDDLSIQKGREDYRRDLESVFEWKTKPELYRDVVYLDSLNILEISLPSWAS